MGVYSSAWYPALMSPIPAHRSSEIRPTVDLHFLALPSIIKKSKNDGEDVEAYETAKTWIHCILCILYSPSDGCRRPRPGRDAREAAGRVF